MGKWAILAICLLSANAAWAAEKGYLSGQEYRGLSENGRSGYVTGAYDALAAWLPWLHQCTDGWSRGQLKAVFDKYLTDRPEMWNYVGASILPEAIASVCPSAPSAFKN